MGIRSEVTLGRLHAGEASTSSGSLWVGWQHFKHGCGEYYNADAVAVRRVDGLARHRPCRRGRMNQNARASVATVSAWDSS